MKRTKLSDQVKAHANEAVEPEKPYEGSDRAISTGSTLLDLSISGGRFREGGIPAGILVEIFGPSSAGKTVLLCEIAGAVQRQGGQTMFRDPEGRLNKEFAKLFDVDMDTMEYDMPGTVPEVFEPVREWEPEPADKVHGIFADSLAALTTDWELEGKDAHGMRRAKEFSQECRMTCRTLTKKDFLMVCSNQVRQNINAGPYGQKYATPGGEAIGFYSSLRLKFSTASKVKDEQTIFGKKMKMPIGIETEIEVFKSTVWKPYRVAPIIIIFDYGIDDIRANLRFLKQSRKDTTYVLDKERIGQSIDAAIDVVEKGNLEQKLKDEVIQVWNEIEEKFSHDRKPKKR